MFPQGAVGVSTTRQLYSNELKSQWTIYVSWPLLLASDMPEIKLITKYSKKGKIFHLFSVWVFWAACFKNARAFIRKTSLIVMKVCFEKDSSKSILFNQLLRKIISEIEIWLRWGWSFKMFASAIKVKCCEQRLLSFDDCEIWTSIKQINWKSLSLDTGGWILFLPLLRKGEKMNPSSAWRLLWTAQKILK